MVDRLVFIKSGACMRIAHGTTRIVGMTVDSVLNFGPPVSTASGAKEIAEDIAGPAANSDYDEGKPPVHAGGLIQQYI
jgi:hypothetical protein